MKFLRYTLLSDGSADRSLIPHLTWLLKQNGISMSIYEEWAELRHLRQMPKGLSKRIETCIDLYPCDLLFVHRDAEREQPNSRRKEIEIALAGLSEKSEQPIPVCVIPVRMQEAWLLFDEAAIRRASGNPNGTLGISLPNLSSIENLPDPKQVLHNLLKLVSERRGRRLKTFNVRHNAGQVSQFIEDFSPLRRLPAFKALETDIKKVIIDNNWE